MSDSHVDFSLREDGRALPLPARRKQLGKLSTRQRRHAGDGAGLGLLANNRSMDPHRKCALEYRAYGASRLTHGLLYIPKMEMTQNDIVVAATAASPSVQLGAPASARDTAQIHLPRNLTKDS